MAVFDIDVCATRKGRLATSSPLIQVFLFCRMISGQARGPQRGHPLWGGRPTFPTLETHQLALQLYLESLSIRNQNSTQFSSWLGRRCLPRAGWVKVHTDYGGVTGRLFSLISITKKPPKVTEQTLVLESAAQDNQEICDWRGEDVYG